MSRERMPSLSTMVRYMSPEAIAERRRKARENFGRVTPVPANVASETAGVGVDSGGAEETLESAASPWERAPGRHFDVADLPSGARPPPDAGAGGRRSPAPRPASAARATPRAVGGRARATWIIVSVCVAIAVLGPLVMILLAARGTPAAGAGSGAAGPTVGAATSSQRTALPVASSSADAAQAVSAATARIDAPPTAPSTPATPALRLVPPRPSSTAQVRVPKVEHTSQPENPPPPAPPKGAGSGDPILNE